MQGNIFIKLYRLIIYIGSNLQSIFLLALRLFWGSSFFFSGLAKLQNIQSIADYFSTLGIPFPLFNAYAASLVECIGGACLFIGLGSRLASLGLATVMTVALYTAHHEAFVGAFEDPQKFITQLPFTYLMTSLIIFIFGPGKLSFDYLIEKRIRIHRHRIR